MWNAELDLIRNAECGIGLSARVLHILNLSVTFVGEVLAASRRRERSFFAQKAWCAEPKASFIAKTIHFTEKMCPFLGQPQGSPLRIQQIQLQYKYGRARKAFFIASCLHDRNSALLIILTRRCTDFFDKAELSKGGFGWNVTFPRFLPRGGRAGWNVTFPLVKFFCLCYNKFKTFFTERW